MKKHILIFFSLLLFLCAFGSYETLRFDHITVQSGLSQSSVFTIHQDYKGYMWFGTTDGLNRYDGHSIIRFGNIPFDKNSLVGNTIYAMYEHNNRYLWLGTTDGLSVMDLNTYTFKNYVKNPSDKNALQDNLIWNIKKDSNNVIWLGTDNGGLSKYDEKNDRFITYKSNPNNPDSLSSDSIYHIFPDGKYLWLGTYDGLDKFDTSTGKVVKKYKHDETDPTSLSDNEVYCVFRDSKKRLWVGTNVGGVNILDEKTEKFKRYMPIPDDKTSIMSETIHSIFEDQDHNIWFGTGNTGLAKFDEKTDTFIHFIHDISSTTSISSNNILTIFQDKTGIMWIGGYENGVDKMNPYIKFMHYSSVINDPNTLSNNMVYSIFEDSLKNIWIGTYTGGLNKFNIKNSSFKVYQNNPEDPTTLAANRIFAIMEDKPGLLWIGSNKGLDKFDIVKETVVASYTSDPENPNSLCDKSIRSMFKDSDSNLWIGTLKGLNFFNPKKNIFKRYFVDSSTGLQQNNIRTIAEDKKGNIWIGTYGGGALILDRKKDKFVKQFQKNDNDLNSLSSNHINIIFCDSKGNIWLGSSNGLNLYQPETDNFKMFLEKDGLPNNTIYAIEEDKRGHIWLSTNRGLADLDPETKIFVKYDYSDGLQSNEFNSRASERLKDGTLIFGGVNGFNVFKPDKFRKTPQLPIITINKFLIGNKSVDAFSDKIKIPYTNKSFMVEFSVLDFVSPEKNQYAYKLEGVDDEWIFSKRNYANYNNLRPGTYLLKVRGANGEGIWNNDGIIYTVEIEAAPWESWPAIILYFILLIILVYLLSKRLAQIRDKKHQEKTNAILKELSSCLDFAKLSDKFIDSIKNITNFDASVIMIKNVSGSFDYYSNNITNKKSVYNKCIELSKNSEDISDNNIFEDFRSFVTTNIIYQNEEIGKIFLFRKNKVFKTLEKKRIISVVEELSIAINNSYLFRELNIKIKELTETRDKLSETNQALELANRTLEDLSMLDGLTSILNRRAFELRLKESYEKLGKEFKDLSLIMIDIDFFKNYNDLYGHLAGDECLKKIAWTLLSGLDGINEIVARYGGEEFVVVLNNADVEKAVKKAEILRKKVEELNLIHAQSPNGKITISLGVSGIKSHGIKSEILINNADTALYTAKKNGKNRVASL